MLRRETGHPALPRRRQTRRPRIGRPRYSGGDSAGQPVRQAAARVALLRQAWAFARPAGCILATQPRVRPREPPFRLAFFIRPSYWLDIMCAWICAVKSMTTTTTISSEVPPK
jgi:hypothetical protein